MGIYIYIHIYIYIYELYGIFHRIKIEDSGIIIGDVMRISWTDPPCLMGKLTMSMVMFNSYVTNYQRMFHGIKIEDSEIIIEDFTWYISWDDFHGYFYDVEFMAFGH